jgi:hypothetical protein
MFRAMSERRKSLLAAVSPDEIAAVGRRLLADALAGNVAAARVLIEQTCGRPPEPASEDSADLNELALRLAAPLSVQVILASLESMSPSAAIDFINAAVAGGRPGIDSVLDKFRAANLADLRRQVLAARAGKT